MQLRSQLGLRRRDHQLRAHRSVQHLGWSVAERGQGARQRQPDRVHEGRHVGRGYF